MLFIIPIYTSNNLRKEFKVLRDYLFSHKIHVNIHIMWIVVVPR
jgi:hypothetical protein